MDDGIEIYLFLFTWMERLFKCRTANIHFYRGTIDYELNFENWTDRNDRLGYSKAIGKTALFDRT